MKYFELNKIHNMDCVEGMKKYIPNKCIDCVITSPPYDNIRKYEQSWSFDYIETINQLFRVVKQGGVVVWNVADQCIEGSESGSSFKQALAFIDRGFRLHDTMIYEKNSPTFPAKVSGNRYTQIFEYMFVFSKGKPKTAKLICDKANKQYPSFDGKIKPPPFSPRNNIWFYKTSFNETAAHGKKSTDHPAVMPLGMAVDHLKTWTNEGDVVLDPFMGSGTTAVACVKLDCNYVGFEVSELYLENSMHRIKKHFNNKGDLFSSVNKELANKILEGENKNE